MTEVTSEIQALLDGRTGSGTINWYATWGRVVADGLPVEVIFQDINPGRWVIITHIDAAPDNRVGVVGRLRQDVDGYIYGRDLDDVLTAIEAYVDAGGVL